MDGGGGDQAEEYSPALPSVLWTGSGGLLASPRCVRNVPSGGMHAKLSLMIVGSRSCIAISCLNASLSFCFHFCRPPLSIGKHCRGVLPSTACESRHALLCQNRRKVLPSIAQRCCQNCRGILPSTACKGGQGVTGKRSIRPCRERVVLQRVEPQEVVTSLSTARVFKNSATICPASIFPMASNSASKPSNSSTAMSTKKVQSNSSPGGTSAR